MAASLGNGGTDGCRDQRVAGFEQYGMVRLCSSKEPRRRERLGGFWWDYEGGDGLPRGPPLPSFSASRLPLTRHIFVARALFVTIFGALEKGF